MRIESKFRLIHYHNMLSVVFFLCQARTLGLQSEFQACLGYRVRPCCQKRNKKESYHHERLLGHFDQRVT